MIGSDGVRVRSIDRRVRDDDDGDEKKKDVRLARRETTSRLASRRRRRRGFPPNRPIAADRSMDAALEKVSRG